MTIFSSTEIPANPQLILITSEHSHDLPKIYDLIDDKPILLVSEKYTDKRNIMINLYETEQGQLKFEINKANIINQGLVIDPEILLAGGTEIDVAGLFRESQFNLRTIQKEYEKVNDSLNIISKSNETYSKQIAQQQLELLNQKIELASQLSLIAESDEKLATYLSEIQAQKHFMESQRDSILWKNNILFKQTSQLNFYKKEELDADSTLNVKLSQIDRLNEDIEYKNYILGNQSEKILQQKQNLILSIIASILAALLCVYILFVYRKNKQKNKILAAQKAEIEQKLQELNVLNIKLKNADQYKSIFLASMSHELRTPLNSIIGYTGIILMGMTGEISDEQKKQLGKVKNNAQHLLNLINDILDISKIEADRAELSIGKVKLKLLINEIIETLQIKADEKKLALAADISEDMEIQTDTRRIKQVLLNLATNAINYTESGFVKLSAEKISGNRIKISVNDSGIGISEEDQQRLFQPFQQIDSSLTKKNKGTGLGLYLCRKIIALLQGEIHVESEVGKGSNFYIILPLTIK